MLFRLFPVTMTLITLAASSCACEPAVRYQRVTTLETVTTWETRSEPEKEQVLLTDHCGTEFIATRAVWRDKRVAVKKLVPVTRIVKVES